MDLGPILTVLGVIMLFLMLGGVASLNALLSFLIGPLKYILIGITIVSVGVKIYIYNDTRRDLEEYGKAQIFMQYIIIGACQCIRSGLLYSLFLAEAYYFLYFMDKGDVFTALFQVFPLIIVIVLQLINFRISIKIFDMFESESSIVKVLVLEIVTAIIVLIFVQALFADGYPVEVKRDFCKGLPSVYTNFLFARECIAHQIYSLFHG